VEDVACGVYLESALREWARAEMDEVFEKQDMHIVPVGMAPTTRFSVETLETLDIDPDRMREFQGELGRRSHRCRVLMI
jgi:hypothetical protein